MEHQILENHKFQFISFCYVYHENGNLSSNKIQINNDSHLLHITRGAGSITIDGTNKFSLRRGAVVSIPRQTPFIMELSHNFEMLNIHYQIWLKDGQYFDDKFLLPYLFFPDYFNRCEQKLKKMHILSDKTLDDMLQIPLLAYDIVLSHFTSCELMEIHKNVIDERIDQVAKYLRADNCHIYDIKAVTKLACLSRSQLNRKFKQFFGIPPHQYWEQQRLRKICLQIKQTQKPFAEIAEDFDFSSPYYFSRWFKKKVACSPSFFRNNPTNY
jgi:AraC-like DNA-binding protein